MAVKLNQHDLEFILKQIKIAEAHVGGTPLTQLIDQPHLPYGLRTVDGSYNNLIPGRENWGASDQLMPRLLDPRYRAETDNESVDINGPAPGGVVNNNDYGNGGNVVDSDPRTITNLISDQTLKNPAAIIAALQFAEYAGNLIDATNAIRGAYQTYLDAAGSAASAAIVGITDPAQRKAAVEAAIEPLRTALHESLAAQYGFEMDGNSIVLPNVAPDEGLSAPFNAWMTFFGQFFDHGLDLIHKGSNGTIFVPLAADDPLRTHGPDGIAGSGDEVPASQSFMVLTRLDPTMTPGPDGVLNTADDIPEARNKTTSYVDQNQTYTSHPSHQVFLREYEMVFDPVLGHEVPVATGRLLDGEEGGLATWADVKRQAQDKLGIVLSDIDVLGVPLLRTDPYGEFIRGEDGFPQVITNIGPDLIPNTADDLTVSASPGSPVVLAGLNGGLGPVRTSHQFLDDIAHNAAPVFDPNSPSSLAPDPDSGTDAFGNPVPFNPNTGANLQYDNELLDRHFITGDGRGNENIGLTAVHHVFHSEHNRQVEDVKKQVLDIAASGRLDDIAFLNEWLLVDVTALPADLSSLKWDGERLFQTARFVTEMQYQHLVFEEFGRKVQPNIDLFVFNTTTDVNPAIFAEFAHTVYRFGHSMLTDHLKLLPLNAAGQPVDANGTPLANALGWEGIDVGLIEAFLNPILFDQNGSVSAEQAAGAIVRGLTQVRGNAIDEFVVESLRNNLLGLPLDLAAINIARGRDAGIPTLNEARVQLYAASSSSWLKPYESWADFGANLKTPASIINFIAAYGTHPLITSALTLEAKRDAAMTLLFGGANAPADAYDFLNGVGSWANQETGLNLVDLWIGGLAERVMPFGGMLGSTFNAVFELQMENLQEGDRFYYLSRTQGLNLLNELENNAFSKLIMANSDLVQPGPDGIRGTADDIVNQHIGVDSFARYDGVLEVDLAKQREADAQGDDPFLAALRAKVVRNDPNTPGTDSNYLRFTGGEHMVMGGTSEADTIIGGDGDDGIWGGAGDDRIEGGHGVDLVVAGAGDDIITDSGDTGDFLKGEDGDDIIANSNGLDVLMGGDGKDVFLVGVDATEVFGGEGDDFMLGGLDHDFLLGNEGDDWMEGGDGFDVLNGDNSELFFNSTILGHDVMIAGENENDFDAESGDDIMVQGESVMRNEGMFGFDWAIYKGSDIAADADMRIPFFTTVADDILRDRFDQTEAISGWDHNDIIRGDDRGSDEEIELELSLVNHELTQAGVDRIDGLRELLDLAEYTPANPNEDPEKVTAWTGGNVLIGGDGGDLIEGRGGNDFIHGDAWLNVRIRITGNGQANTAANEIATVDTLKHVFAAGQVDSAGEPIPAAWHGKSLSELLLSREIRPNQLHIVREIKYDENPSNDTDTAVFAGNRDWYEITHVGDKTFVARREMEEVDPQIDEGVDTLVGIERILFADGIYTIRQTGNYDPTGRLTIGGLPAQEGEPLTVNASAIRDANNPDGLVPSSAITYRWQIERNDGTGDYINIPGASGTSFTPTEEHVGLRIRVLGTYTDGGGVLEVVTSQPTDPVGNVDGEPTGNVLISDMSPTEGQPLTATAAFSDPDGMTDAFEEGLLIYQWEYSTDGTTWVSVPAADGGNARTFEPGPELVGMRLRMRINYTDDGGNPEQVISAATEIVGNLIGSDAPVINAVTGGDTQGGTTVGDDVVLGGASANQISGGAGNDVLLGAAGADTLSGDAGNDTLNGGAGDDTVNGGAGNDTVIYGNGEGADVIDGGDGSDTLRIVEGTFGADDSVAVVLAGGIITSLNGIATVANVEAAELHLDGGNDTLTYQTDQNVSVNLLSGAATGFAFLRGVENVTAGGGNDTLLGNAATNTLGGGDGNDDVRGGFGDDVLLGGAGNDDLYGQEGDDVLEGGAGNDRIDGGVGNDTASYASAAAAVTVSLSATPTRASFEEQDTQGAGLDRLIGIENLIGSAHNDSLTGDGNANIIDGGAGADTMDGGAGDDTYIVDNAGDAINDASGVDTVRTALAGYVLDGDVENLVLTGNAAINGIGNALDNEITGNSANNTLNGAGGTDTVVLLGAISDHAFALAGAGMTVTSAAGGVDTLVSIERAKIGGNSYLIVPGTNAANTGAGAVIGGSQAELLLGFNGADELRGNGGDDILVGGAGADQMFGGAGNDAYWVQQAGDVVTELPGEGIDTIYSNVTRNLTVAAQVNGEVENVVLVGTTGTEALSATGNNLNNVLTGNAGNNTLNGGAGNDTLVGNAGDDNLVGGANDDILDGGAGDDTLNGGIGTDTAVFAGKVGDYRFGLNAGGLATVTHLATGDTDTLSGIEKLRFGDGPVLDVVTNVAGIPTGPAILFGTNGADTIVGGPGADVIIGGAGDDILNGSDVGDGDNNAIPGSPDDDTFIWYVGDGSDTINGGLEAANGDLFQVIGNSDAETYRIYTYDEAVARIGFAGSDEAEIVVTRQVGSGVETIIAELTEIEEIVVNGAGVSGNGTAGGDSFEMYGDFSVSTSLRPNTITVLGSEGDDTIDITSLRSAHRIVFKTGGGNDTIIGTLRPQDVIELPDGATIADYAVTIDEETGLTKLAGDGHSLTFVAPHGMPDFGANYPGDDQDDDDDEDDDDDVPTGPGGDDDDDTGNGDEDDDDDEDDEDDDDDDDDDDSDGDDGACGGDDDDDSPNTPAPAPTGSGAVRPGTPSADVLLGTSGNDTIVGLAGDDVLLGEAGDDAISAGDGNDVVEGGAGRDALNGGWGDDHIFGGAGADLIQGEAGVDRIFGQAGNDLINAGAGNDTAFGGAGDDLFIGEAGDGNDSYWGDEIDGGNGIDTLDLSTITADLTVDLGNGLLGRGSAVSSQSGTDTLWSIENVATGSGNDTITASRAVNVMEGGAGNDTFRFLDVESANGDTILDFEPGDRLDLSGIDADLAVPGNQSFTLVAGPAFTASAQLMVSYETRDGADYTIVKGNVGAGVEEEFRIELKGTHTLNGTNFTL